MKVYKKEGIGSFWTRNIPTKREYYLREIANNLKYILWMLGIIAGILFGGFIGR
jgi:hypothetical protein